MAGDDDTNQQASAPDSPGSTGIGRFDLTPEHLVLLLHDEPRFRARQVWEGLVEKGLEIDELSNCPKPLRQRLAAMDELAPSLSLAHESVADNGRTVKWLWRLHDGAHIETVLIRYRDRATVCISSQAGCAMACGFCATGQGGFRRHLRVGEIVEQVARARRRAADEGYRLSNVVYMGMGEPLANYGPMWASIERLHGDFGLSARHLTVSTVGVVPGIRRLAGEALPVNLAVSLHAADDAKRDRLVPLNRTYPLHTIADAVSEYFEAKGRRVSFEWACIRDVNDTPGDARQLAAYARPLGAHVNLIPLNPTPGYPAVGTSLTGVREFCERLIDLGVNATVRQSRGTSIDAACGQLAARIVAG